MVFQGAVPNNALPCWYNAADVFCLASRGEGSPNVLTEALACGCPAVAADVGAVKEIMESEKNLGRCVPSENIDSLSAALCEVLHTGYDRSRSAQTYGQYHWAWCAENTYQVYQKVMAGKQ